ncbi:glycosyltransferase family 4 protein [Spirosoma sp. RP8]|uniref:Glycosyltransferase family 4 protein n=1 Tax=Spirosoma liriopis TaxID=2937440 RepID=A0ABT0HRU5_9BACT|nr:glycosyltransferase family 4 protein [Spirosoma liriopis]
MYKVIQYGVYPQSYDLIKGGMEASVYGLTKALTQQPNVHVKVITYPDQQYLVFERDYSTANLEVVRLPNRYAYTVLSVLSVGTLIREIRNYGPDMCHLHGTTLLVFLISIYLRLSGCNYVVTVHGIANVEYQKAYERNRRKTFLVKQWLYGFIEWLLINNTAKIVVDTDYVKEWVQRHRLLPCRQLMVVPQGIDERYYQPSIGKQEQHLVSIGSISERKGFEYTIRAFGQVRTSLPGQHLYIIGFRNDEAYYQKLIRLIETLALQDCVHVITDASQDQLLAYLQQAALFILHSHEESQGIVFCEAMALGKPIVATNVGGIPYVVNHGLNGFLTTYGDVDTFARSIVQILIDKPLHDYFSQNNLIQAEQYRWSHIAAILINLYKS